MPHLPTRLAAGTVVALGLTMASTAVGHAAPPPGTKCDNGSAVINTNGQCVPNGSMCFLTDGILIGWTNGDTGRCVSYNLSQSY
ncbi:hypothetical protein [Nocardia arthritidis]|uniref:DUF3761 domain-containing protein n=1 Tax=Nocardia arthritidis TaxID=228602 RepID=A0A6G9YF65_9NOCA|nr:hypothetical protein [Nocardia arthritidis]QIS11686.1 hypothetical protein F5544_19090 [Nocardia arthritidis]